MVKGMRTGSIGSVTQIPRGIQLSNPAWQVDGMNRPAPPTCKTRKGPACNGTLGRRGSLTIWFGPAMSWEAASTGKRGRRPDDNDAAIQAV